MHSEEKVKDNDKESLNYDAHEDDKDKESLNHDKLILHEFNEEEDKDEERLNAHDDNSALMIDLNDLDACSSTSSENFLVNSKNKTLVAMIDAILFNKNYLKHAISIHLFVFFTILF